MTHFVIQLAPDMKYTNGIFQEFEGERERRDKLSVSDLFQSKRIQLNKVSTFRNASYHHRA